MPPDDGAPPTPAAKRRDAAANIDRIVMAASLLIRPGGDQVPMASIAAQAGVGVGTVYRHFPDRRHLLGELTHRSFQRVLEHADRSKQSRRSGIDAVAAFLDAVITDRDALHLLPLHGGPPIVEPRTEDIQREIRRQLDDLLRRGRDDGTIRPGVAPTDIIVAGALLAQPLPRVADWDDIARRHLDTFLRGLRPGAASQPGGHG